MILGSIRLFRVLYAYDEKDIVYDHCQQVYESSIEENPEGAAWTDTDFTSMQDCKE